MISSEKRKEKIDTEIASLYGKKMELEKIVIKVLNSGAVECEVDIPEQWRDMLMQITTIEDPKDEDERKLFEVSDSLHRKELQSLSKIFALADLFECQKKIFKVVFEEETELAIAVQLLEVFEVEIKK